MVINSPADDSEIALSAARLVLLRYGAHLHRDRHFEIFQLSRLGPRAMEHEAFHSGIDYSEDPLVAVDFIREQRKVGVAVARLLFWARHSAFEAAVAAINRPVEEAVAELLTRRVVPHKNFAPKHQGLQEALGDWLVDGSLAFDQLLGAYFKGESVETVATLFGDQAED